MVTHRLSRILIVDDDESIRLGLKEMLEEEGFRVDVASDGFEAGLMAIRHEPRLMILDLKMKGLDGFQTCRLMKHNPFLKEMKILALTGFPSKLNTERILKLGADDCLAKPIERKALFQHITSLLNS